jgi:hypothetical protein
MTAHDPAVSSAGPAPATDRDTLERVARRLAARDWCIDEEGDDDWERRGEKFRADYLEWAREVLTVLPAPDQQAAALSDRERAMLGFALEMAQEEIHARSLEFTDDDKSALDSLRRLAGEAQQDEAGAPWATDGARIGRALIWSWSDIGKGEFGRGYRAAQEEARAILTRALTRGAQQDRCPSCDHKREYHDAGGRCWFTVDHGTPGSNLVCPCAPRRDASEAQQDPTQDGCTCDHPADEHNVYGCEDDCACEWMPKRKPAPAKLPPMDPVHILGIDADTAVSQPGQPATDEPAPR